MNPLKMDSEDQKAYDGLKKKILVAHKNEQDEVSVKLELLLVIMNEIEALRTEVSDHKDREADYLAAFVMMSKK